MVADSEQVNTEADVDASNPGFEPLLTRLSLWATLGENFKKRAFTPRSFFNRVCLTSRRFGGQISREGFTATIPRLGSAHAVRFIWGKNDDGESVYWVMHRRQDDTVFSRQAGDGTGSTSNPPGEFGSPLGS